MFGLSTGLGKLRILADGLLERCDKKKREDRVADVNLDFVVEEDELYVNGNCSFNADLDAWKVKFWSDKKAGSSWYRAPVQMSNIDVCKSIVDQKSFLYPFIKDFPPCPVKKGVSFQHCMDHLTIIEFSRMYGFSIW